ncbi:unnamed protein product, partial [Chrysoparadoxa australica]
MEHLDDPYLLPGLAVALVCVLGLLSFQLMRAKKGPAGDSAEGLPVVPGLPRWLGFFGGQTVQLDPSHMTRMIEGFVEKYGNGGDVELFLMGKRVITVTDPKEWQRIMLHRPTKFERAPNMRWMTDVALEMEMAPSLFLSDTYTTPTWGELRRLSSSAFNVANVKLMLPALNQITRSLIESWKRKAGSVEYIDGLEELKMLASSVIGLVGYGHDMRLFHEDVKEEDLHTFEGLCNTLAMVALRLFSPFYTYTWYIPFMPWVRKYKADMRHIDGVIDKFIQKGIAANKARKAGQPVVETTGFLLDKMVASSVLEKGEKGLSVELIRMHLKGFYVAGTDTTARGMSWCLYFLAANKRIQTKLQAEVDKVLGDDSVPTTHEQV